MAKMMNPELEVVRFENEDVIAASFQLNADGTVTLWSNGYPTTYSTDGRNGSIQENADTIERIVFGDSANYNHYLDNSNGSSATLNDILSGNASATDYAGSYSYDWNTTGDVHHQQQ